MFMSLILVLVSLILTNGHRVSTFVSTTKLNPNYWCHVIIDTVTGNLTDIWPVNEPYSRYTTFSFHPKRRLYIDGRALVPWTALNNNLGQGNMTLTFIDDVNNQVRNITEFVPQDFPGDFWFYDSTRQTPLEIRIEMCDPLCINVNIIQGAFSENRTLLYCYSIPRPDMTLLTASFAYNDIDRLIYLSVQLGGPNYLLTFNIANGTVRSVGYPESRSAQSLNLVWSPSRSQLYNIVSFGTGPKAPVPELRSVDPATGLYKTVMSGSSLPASIFLTADDFDELTGDWLLTQYALPSWLVVNVDSARVINNGSIATVNGALAGRIYSPSILSPKFSNHRQPMKVAQF